MYVEVSLSGNTVKKNIFLQRESRIKIKLLTARNSRAEIFFKWDLYKSAKFSHSSGNPDAVTCQDDIYQIQSRCLPKIFVTFILNSSFSCKRNHMTSLLRWQECTANIFSSMITNDGSKDLVLSMYSSSKRKKKRNTHIYFNTNYHTEMKLVPIIMD